MARERQHRSAEGKLNVVDVGARVREARSLLGLTQLELAQTLGLGTKGYGGRTVQAWERNDRTPKLDSLIPLAEMVDRPVAWFYGAGDEHEEAAA